MISRNEEDDILAKETACVVVNVLQTLKPLRENVNCIYMAMITVVIKDESGDYQATMFQPMSTILWVDGFSPVVLRRCYKVSKQAPQSLGQSELSRGLC